MAKKATIKQDAFVTKIIKTPAQPAACLLFKGFVGKGARTGYLRVYSDAELSDYVDVPTNTILHTQSLSAQESTLGGSYLWVQRDAQLIHSPADGGAVATFLDGPVYQEYLKQMKAASKSKAAAGTLPMGVTRFGCPGRQIQHQGVGPIDGPGPSIICH